MVTLVRLEQLLNAQSPIVITVLGMVMLVRLKQAWNAYSPIPVTLEGMVTLVTILPNPKIG